MHIYSCYVCACRWAVECVYIKSLSLKPLTPHYTVPTNAAPSDAPGSPPSKPDDMVEEGEPRQRVQRPS